MSTPRPGPRSGSGPDDDLGTLLRRGLDEHLDDHYDQHATPTGDLARVQHEGGRLRRAHRRRRALASVGGVAAAAVVAGAGWALLPQVDEDPVAEGFEPVGQLDFSAGVRAYAAPGEEIHLGGRVFPWERLERLDTDAAATPYGVVHFPDGVPHLLREDGTTVRLEQAARPMPGELSPSAKADAVQPWVAYVHAVDDGLVLTVRDLGASGPTGLVVARHTLECGDACKQVTIDAIDRGEVFFRLAEETWVWTAQGDQVTRFSGAGTRVAAVRNGVVLYDGKKPDGLEAGDWDLVRGSIDAQLTHDGRYVLDWSHRLEPVFPDDRPIVLEQGAGSVAWYTIDTDGSVLVAELVGGNRSRVHDCEVPSGECVELGVLEARHGDPMFIGNDM